MLKVGDKVKFDHLKDIKIHGLACGRCFVTGTVVEIHKEHRWFSVEYKIGDSTQRTSFSFSDIDDKVKVVK